MNENLIPAIKGFLSWGWSILNGVNFPGTEFSFAKIGIALMLVSLGLRILGMCSGAHVLSSEVNALRNKNLDSQLPGQYSFWKGPTR